MRRCRHGWARPRRSSPPSTSDARGRRGPWLAAALSLVACKPPDREPAPEPIANPTIVAAVATAERLAIGDLDGDGRPELILADAASLWVADLRGRELGRLPAPGGVQVLRAADLDGDGRAEILAGWGRDRAHREAEARVARYQLVDGALVEELVVAPVTERDDVVALLPLPGASAPTLIVAYFESKYVVRLARAERGEAGWALTPIDSIRMATSVTRGDLDGDGEAELVVGRVYGEGPDGEGDAFVLRPDGSREPIPIVGGVRSLAIADLDGDGRDELLIGDGWNKDYGRVARARLTRAWWDGAGFHSELLDDSAGEFTLWDLFAADLDGDGQREIVTRGSGQVRVLSRVGGRWQPRGIASACEDVALLELDAALGGDRLIAACAGRATVWPAQP